LKLAKVDVGKVANDQLADTYNTVLKMAKKRSHVDAVLTATAAGDIFTQDVEDTAPPSEGADAATSAAGAAVHPSSAAASDPSGGAEEEATKPMIDRLKALLGRMEKTEKEIDGYFAREYERYSMIRSSWVRDQAEKAERFLERLKDSGEGPADGQAPSGEGSEPPSPEQTAFEVPEKAK
jgi:hypothetical protein